jgi:hypothetical protein
MPRAAKTDKISIPAMTAFFLLDGAGGFDGVGAGGLAGEAGGSGTAGWEAPAERLSIFGSTQFQEAARARMDERVDVTDGLIRDYAGLAVGT